MGERFASGVPASLSCSHGQKQEEKGVVVVVSSLTGLSEM